MSTTTVIAASIEHAGPAMQHFAAALAGGIIALLSLKLLFGRHDEHHMRQIGRFTLIAAIVLGLITMPAALTAVVKDTFTQLFGA